MQTGNGTFDIAWQRSLTGAPGFCLKKKEKMNNSMVSITISVLTPIACIVSVCWSLPILACRMAQSYSLKFCWRRVIKLVFHCLDVLILRQQTNNNDKNY